MTTQHWPLRCDPAPGYSRNEPFAWMTERSRRRLAKATRLHAAAGALLGAMAAIPWVSDPSLGGTMYAACLCGAALQLFLALPLHAGALVFSCAEDLRGDGDEEGHHLHLLAIPDLPRPLYLHLWRATLASFGSNRLVWMALLAGIGWIVVPIAAASIAAKFAGPRPAASLNIHSSASLWAMASLWAVAPAFALAAVFSLGSALLARGAVGLAAVVASRLGAATRLALDADANDGAIAALGSRFDFDDAWDRQRVRGAGGMAAASARWLADFAAGVFLHVLAALVAFGVPGAICVLSASARRPRGGGVWIEIVVFAIGVVILFYPCHRAADNVRNAFALWLRPSLDRRDAA